MGKSGTMDFHLAFQIITLIINLQSCTNVEVWLDGLTGGEKYDPTEKYNFPTYFPTNVDTKKAKPVVTVVPLTLFVAALEKVLFKNTGKSVTVQINQRTLDGISGGVLYPDKYTYEKSRYYWTTRTDSSARAASTENNKGQPLEISFIYWNQKYGNFSNALNYRDGLCIVSIPIAVGSLPNPAFIFTQEYLEKVKKAGTEVPAELSTTLLPYVPSVPEIYYAYPGSYTDEKSGKTYFCATVILGIRLQNSVISKAQFQGFLNLKNYAGQPLTNQPPLHRNQGQSVVQAYGCLIVPQLT